MKKTLTIMSILLLCCSFVFAQGATEGSKDETITLEFMQWWEPEMASGAMEKICSDYEAANPGIKIKRISKPYAEVQSQVTIGAASGTLSDVLGCDPTWIYNLVKQGAVKPLDEFMAADNYDESQLASVSVLNGKKYLINVENFVYPLFYNVDMFEAGIVDPAKVERVAMQNAVSVASLLLTTEATVTDIKADTPAAPAMPDMGGMGGMPGMGM